MPPTAVVIRQMVAEDLDDVLRIENICFDTPWSRAAFENELIKEYAQSFVAVGEEDRVIGYLIQWLIADEIHIANIAVDPHFQYRGVGSRLLQKGIDACPACAWIGLEVREGNKAAEALYRRFGFDEVGIRKDYYGKNKNAVLMVKRIDSER